MNKSTIVILFLIFATFLPSFSNGGSDSLGIDIDIYKADGYVSYVVNTYEKQTDNNDDDETLSNPDINKCACEGTGIIKHKDGHATPCPYHSKQDTPAVNKISKQILFFTMKTCGPCLRFKASEIPKLKKSGWKVSSSEDAMVRVLDISKYPDLWKKYKSSNSVPQFVLVSDGKKVKTVVGFNTATQIANLYNNM
jgi:hypothetical protein